MFAVAVGLRVIWRFLVTAIVLLILYAGYVAVRQGEPNPTAWTLLVAVGALALATAVAVWSRHIVATYVQICAIPILAALYLFEFGRQDPLDQMLHLEQLWGLVKSKRASGRPVTIQYSPATFVQKPNGGIDLPNGEQIFPLAQVADLPTIMCREGARPFAEFEADERGFNNPKGIWGKDVDLMFIGDSMTYGACLPNRDHFVAQIRQRYPATLNLGVGGIGPLIELAMMREFVPEIRPRYIFFMYDENNDLYFVRQDGDADLVGEYRNPILRKYLEDDLFSQRVYERPAEINAAIKQIVDGLIASELEKRTPLNSLLRVFELPLTRASLPPMSFDLRQTWSRQVTASPWPSIAQKIAINEPADPKPETDYFGLFEQIIFKAIRISEQAGAKLVFVNIPAQGTVCDGIDHPWKKRVLDFVRKTGVDLIDLERDFRNADKTIGRDALFAVPPCGGHFSEVGYKIIGDRLVQYLEIKEALAKIGNLDVPAEIVKEGWSFPASPLALGAPADSTAKVVWSETHVYRPYVKFSAVLAAGSDAPARTEGAAILGQSYKRHRNGNGLRITVKFTAYSPQDNEIVAALFLGGETKSSRAAAEPVKAGTLSSVMLTYETDRLSDAVFDMEVRVGSRRPGILYINGDDNGPIASDLKSSLTIEELGRPDQFIYFGARAPDQLVYSGVDLSELELLNGRRAMAERMRKLAPGSLAQALDATKLWVVRQIATTEVFHHQQEYQPYGQTDRVIELHQGTVVDVEGAAIMGYSWRPKSAGDLIRVNVVVPAWTDRSNAVVVALFLDQEVVASKISSQRISAGQVSSATLEFELLATSTQAKAVSVRVGPALPGTIYLNGNAAGSDPDMRKPTMTIKEYRPPFWS